MEGDTPNDAIFLALEVYEGNGTSSNYRIGWLSQAPLNHQRDGDRPKVIV